MGRQRLLMIGLDGFELGLAERFLKEGSLPNLARIREHSARYELDHGRDKYSGLSWEHFSSGKAPRDGGRWSAIMFDPRRYEVRQTPTSERPFMADLSARTVVFDVPYCKLSKSPHVRGLTNWGAHDPGVAAASRPAGIHEELHRLFGPYPAAEWIYGFCWPSVDKARAAGDALARAVGVRTQASRWLLRERIPDWDLAIVVVSEAHSAIETLWHGVDPKHPLHGIESAPAAASGLLKVYKSIDCLIGDLWQSFPDAILLIVAMHGMGPNDSDVAAMALLPELLYRNAFGVPYMRPIPHTGATPDGVPLLAENDLWDDVMRRMVPRKLPRLSDRIAHLLFRLARPDLSVEWVPAARYAQFWPRMPAFALPAYYDGRVRINLVGREAKGIVPRNDYGKACEEMMELVGECRNLLTGEKVVDEIHRPKGDPNEVGPYESDVYVVWRSAPLGLYHPKLGSIGPLPYRRTGGHTGGHGFLYITGSGITPGTGGLISSFDVVPTIVELLGENKLSGISGRSVARDLGTESNQSIARI
jgi:predicted AlkP superfamily phosphohydrolase/phosphomutase